MTEFESSLFTVVLISTFIALILYLIFGQITVRRLRKNPETTTALGTEFVSGWDIINVAQALAIPRSWAQKLQKSPLSALYANVDLLYEYTTKFDRVLAFIFYWLLMFSGLSGILLVLFDVLGVFD